MSADLFAEARKALDKPVNLRVRHPEHEVAVECAGCRQTVLVCGMIDDLPDPYRCISCRELVDPRADTLAGKIAQARKAAGA